MSTLHSAYSTEEERYLPEYVNREDGRKLVRELIEDLVSNQLDSLEDTDRLRTLVPEWASAHPIALLEGHFRIEIRQHESPIDPEGS